MSIETLTLIGIVLLLACEMLKLTGAYLTSREAKSIDTKVVDLEDFLSSIEKSKKNDKEE